MTFIILIGLDHPGGNEIFLYKSDHDMDFRHGSAGLYMIFVILLAGTITVAIGYILHDMDFRCGISKIQVSNEIDFLLWLIQDMVYSFWLCRNR
jgi:hypothetical protein